MSALWKGGVPGDHGDPLLAAPGKYNANFYLAGLVYQQASFTDKND